MGWNDINITGIPIVDFLFNTALKLVFMWITFVFFRKAGKDYSDGAIGRMMVNVIVGIIFLAGILGFNNTLNLVKGFSGIFENAPTSSSSGNGM